MKKYILFLVSIVLAIAGIVAIVILTISLSNSNRKIKSMKVEQSKLINQVVILSTGKLASGVDQKSALYRRDFVSHFDSMPDSYVLAPPISPPIGNKYTLIIYLHGMGSNYMEPYTVSPGIPVGNAIHKKYPSFIIASLSYGKETAWGNDKSKSDITQNIQELLYAYPVNKIIIIGTSMGGCVALNYPALAPKNIKDKIIGVISAEGSGDLASLYETTTKDVVKLGIARAMGGNPSKTPLAYQKASALKNLDKIPKSVRFSIISGKKDDTVPPQHQINMIKALSDGQYPNYLIELDTGHDFPQTENYMKALSFVLQK